MATVNQTTNLDKKLEQVKKFSKIGQTYKALIPAFDCYCHRRISGTWTHSTHSTNVSYSPKFLNLKSFGIS